MSNNNPILLRDILIWARQESLHARHYFLGVEHLFIALLQIQGGLAQSILQDQKIPAQSFIKVIRRRAGAGNTQAAWPGVRYTPRMKVILDMANDIALSNNRTEITERELFSAIVTEKESLPMRLLKNMGADLAIMEQAARTRTPLLEPQLPDVGIDFGPHYDNHNEIPDNQLVVLRRMFSSYAKIRVERRLTGFRSALILVITPIHANNQEDAPVVVKIDQVDNILDEAQHYEAHIKNAAVLYTARLEEAPMIPENALLGGLKYTLVANDGIIPLDLRNRIQREGTGQLANLFEELLYNRFKKYWWGQARPYRFHVWQEYDWVLPSVLTLDLQVDENTPSHMHLLRIPFRRTYLKNTLKNLQPGDHVVLENFTVQKVDHKNKTLKLALKYGAEAENRAFRIDVRLPEIDNSFYRGEIIDRLVGTVWKTRDAMLLDAVRALSPAFNPTSIRITIGQYEFENPLYAYEDVLDYFIRGSASRIHGDLNLSNILVGPENGLWLIDFGHTREGHTLFDWAALEVSLLGDAVMSAAGDSWESAIKMMRAVMIINKSKHPPESNNTDINQALKAIITIRKIVATCLANSKHWEEYYVALALCSLRAISWETMPLGGRRLMFLVAGMLIQEVSSRAQFTTSDTPSPDITESLPTVRQLTELSLENRKQAIPIEQPASPTPIPSSFSTKRLEDSETAKALERLEHEQDSDKTLKSPPEPDPSRDMD